MTSSVLAHAHEHQETMNNVTFDNMNHIGKAKQNTAASEIPVMSTGLTTITKIIMGLIIAISVLSIAVGLGVGLSLSKRNSSDNNSDNSSNTTSSCGVATSSQCIGVPASIQDYIFSNYTNASQARALLQLSRSLSAIPASNISNQTQLVLTYQAIVDSVQCMSLHMPNSYVQAYRSLISMQLNDLTSLQNYLTTITGPNGDLIRLTPYQNLASKCQFSTVSQTPNLGSTASCDEPTDALLYLASPFLSPVSIINQMNIIKQTLSTNRNTNFAQYGFLKPKRADAYPISISNIIQSFKQQLLSNSSTFSNLQITKTLSILVDGLASANDLPGNITIQIAQNLYFYLANKTYFQYNSQFYYWGNQLSLVTDYIDNGSRVVILTHGEQSHYGYYLFIFVNRVQSSTAGVCPFFQILSIPYITNQNDLIYNKFLQMMQNIGFILPPSPNVANSTFNASSDGMNHDILGYVSTYRAQFINMISKARKSAVKPFKNYSNSLITAYLSFDDYASHDFDLYIYEPPNMTHINWFMNSIDYEVNNGQLLIPQFANGPEYYHTIKCQITPGDYIFKVNYYQGEGSQMGTLEVHAGNQTFTKTFTLTTAIGGSGDSIPSIWICTVHVDKDSQGNYLFSISQPVL